MSDNHEQAVELRRRLRALYADLGARYALSDFVIDYSAYGEIRGIMATVAGKRWSDGTVVAEIVWLTDAQREAFGRLRADAMRRGMTDDEFRTFCAYFVATCVGATTVGIPAAFVKGNSLWKLAESHADPVAVQPWRDKLDEETARREAELDAEVEQ